MTKKDYLEFIFFMCCTFFTLIIFDLFWGINTGMSFNDNCIIGNIDEFKNSGLVDYLLIYGLYFLFGILPFGWSFILYMLLKTKVPAIDKFFSPDKSKKMELPGLKESNIRNIVLTLIHIPFPLIIYDLLLC